MNALKTLIQDNLQNHPELEEYNKVVIAFIVSYSEQRPDMAIEGCKSLIESVSRFVFDNIEVDVPDHRSWEGLSLAQKFKSGVQKLNLDPFEQEFVTTGNSQLVAKLGEIRNKRGDISHGQSYPKNSYSSAEFTKFIVLWTEGLCFFMLSKYIAFKREEEYKQSEFSAKQIEEFDEYLNGLYPDLKYINYSTALKDQDPGLYEQEINKYYDKKLSE